MPFSDQTLGKLCDITESYCSDQQTGIPGATVVVVGKDGDELFAHSAGTRGLGSKQAMSLNNVFWIASCTKVVTAMACMQLVERGELKLDDGAQLEGLCPELKDLKVAKADGSFEDKKRQITLRMLLTHTAGFGYSFFNERLRDWGVDEFSEIIGDIPPLLFQPGESWQYGVSLDWAGVALERATGVSVNDYMQKNIMIPLGLHNTSMIPTEKMKSNLVYMHSRKQDGTLVPRDHLVQQPLIARTKEEIANCFNSGGGGLFAKPQEYCKILAVFLNDGTCPRTGAQLLRKETVDDMFRNQIPEFPNFGRQPIPAARPDLTNPVSELYPTAGDPPQGWGLSFMLSGSNATGRSKGTVHWAGLPNLWWWCDRENGVAGMVCTQILPFADAKVLGLWAEVESEVYRGLAEAKK